MAIINNQDLIELCMAKLSAVFGTSVQFADSRSVGGGCINHAVKISCSVGDFFLKWNASVPADFFLKEASGLTEMRSVNNPFLIIPAVIWSKEAGELPGLLLMEYYHPAATTSGFEERLGRGIAQLHRQTAPAFGFHHPNYCGTSLQDNTWTSDWAEFFGQRRIWSLIQQIRSSRGISAEDLNIYEMLVERMPKLLAHSTVPSLIHGDLWSGNYMYTSKGPALIDPACYYADREMELGMMKLFGGFPSRAWSAYQEEYPLPESWKERIRLYQLYHLLNHYLLFGGSYGRQAFEIAKTYVP